MSGDPFLQRASRQARHRIESWHRQRRKAPRDARTRCARARFAMDSPSAPSDGEEPRTAPSALALFALSAARGGRSDRGVLGEAHRSSDPRRPPRGLASRSDRATNLGSRRSSRAASPRVSRPNRGYRSTGAQQHRVCPRGTRRRAHDRRSSADGKGRRASRRGLREGASCNPARSPLGKGATSRLERVTDEGCLRVPRVREVRRDRPRRRCDGEAGAKPLLRATRGGLRRWKSRDLNCAIEPSSRSETGVARRRQRASEREPSHRPERRAARGS